MRLDEYLFKNGYTESRAKAQDIILAGCVFVNDIKVTSKAQNIKDIDKINIIQNRKYVSRAGSKLEKAFLEFDISVKDKESNSPIYFSKPYNNPKSVLKLK